MPSSGSVKYTAMFKTRLVNLIAKRHLIPDEFWVDGCIWFYDESAGGYEWDACRIGFNRDGNVIWAFDSGCSCNSPWDQFDPSKCSTMEPKRFILANFFKEKGESYSDLEVNEDKVEAAILDFELLVRKRVKPQEVLSAQNAEVRRYLIKRIGYEKIKDDVKAEVLHVDGDNELLKFASGEMYVKVKDLSTDREYLLFVEGSHKTCRSAIAWTFGLQEHEYNPIIET